MKILILDPAGLALDWALRCQDDGHKVKWFIRQSEKTKSIGRGLVDIVDDFTKWMHWADLVFMSDNTKYLQQIDAYRKEGVLVVGPTQETADWELDRGRGQEVLRKAGIGTPPGKVFSDYDKAIAYVKRENRRFVSKPSGDADKALSYVSKSPADMVYMLERWKLLGKLKSPFILQEFIAGTEMAVGAWHGPAGFARGWCENWEFKKLMNDDLGVATGEQGTVVRYVAKSKLADMVLKPMGDQLRKAGYIGYVDVNCIIDDAGMPWPLEFTMRPGWPTFNIQQALHKGDAAQWLKDLATGEQVKTIELDTIAVGVVMAIPDYPYSKFTRKEVTGIPLYGLAGKIRSNVHPCEMMAGEAPTQVGDQVLQMPCLVSAGDYILVASGTGSTITEAKKMAYRILKKLSMPNSPFYRTDIGNRLKKQLPDLQAHGFAKDLSF